MIEITLEDPSYPGDFISYSEQRSVVLHTTPHSECMRVNYKSTLYLSRQAWDRIRSRTGLFSMFKTRKNSYPGEFRADVYVRTVHMFRFHMP